jgi:hypothetical protein
MGESEYVGLDQRTGRLRDEFYGPLNEGVTASDHWDLDFRREGSGEVLADVLVDLGWNYTDPAEQQRLVVNPHDEVNREMGAEFVPERDYSERMREYCRGRIEFAEEMSDEELGESFWEQYRKEALQLQREHHQDLNDFMRKVSEKALEEEHKEVDSLDGEFDLRNVVEYHRNQNPEFQEYSGDREEDLERAIHNTHERGERLLADTLSKSWLQILEQELYRSGWDYQGEELFPVYTVRDDGFIDFWQHTVSG